MIKLFRNIRQNLLAEGKITKYFKYAIGEIVLVVIGILIALQINTNSENNKKQQFEITILKNIKEDILADKLDYNQNLIYTKLELFNEKLLFDFLMDERIVPFDTIDYSSALGIDLISTIHNASFINLQNNDIGLISNNDLYKKITRFYDYYAAALNKIENEHDYSNTYKNKLVYFEKYFRVIPKKTTLLMTSKDDTFKQEFERYNFEMKEVTALKNDEGFKVMLAESIFINTFKVSFYQQILEKTEELTKSIDSELQSLSQ
jgi:hypothetical protein